MRILTLTMILIVLTACVAPPAPSQPAATKTPVETSPANLANPASVNCIQQGNRLELRTAADGGQIGICIFPDGRECEEWAYFRGECGVPPTATSETALSPTAIPTAMPIDAADYEGWWAYTHTVYNFSIKLPADWVVEEVTTNDPLMNGHALNTHPKLAVEKENIRLTFRRAGDEVRLWPTGVGQGEFIAHGTLEIAGQPAQRLLLVCPTGEITAIWYHQAEGQPNITRGDLEFGVIFSATPSHCEAGYSLSGKAQRVGEMIIASLTVP